MVESSKSNGLILRTVLWALGTWIRREFVKFYIDSFKPASFYPLKIPESKTSNVKIRRIYKGSREINVKRVIDVKASSLPYHVERGWKKNSGIHRGYYRCRLGAFKGEIEERVNGDYKFFIYNPPKEVLTGHHKPCFTDNGNNRYHIHFVIDAKNIDSGVMAVERLLTESFQRR
jgi:hypothetical protein